jgi:glutamate formiminotransferase / formiminotetrahydrofolate cyclodeaminase
MAKEKQIVECVPNFSEGRDIAVVRQIADAVESVDGVMLLNIDPGEATNRTVITFAGEPEAVAEAAFRAVDKAAQLIDMRQQHGAHPRIGATDVLPIVPVSGITLEECAELSRRLAKRMADELQIPCYCYEAAAFKPEHRNLALCRKGEYEGLAERVDDDVEAPDFGRRPFDEQLARTGCSVVGARNYLIAVNFNLNSTSKRLASAIACDVREKGRQMREGDAADGKKLFDANGQPIMKPGTLKATKAIGWYIDEYGIAQVSMNITNIDVTPLHKAFEEVSRCARNRGLQVTGTEIIGLVPERTLLEAGRYFLAKQQRSADVPAAELVKVAIESMGLSDLCEFKPEEKVIEYVMASRANGHDRQA